MCVCVETLATISSFVAGVRSKWRVMDFESNNSDRVLERDARGQVESDRFGCNNSDRVLERDARGLKWRR